MQSVSPHSTAQQLSWSFPGTQTFHGWHSQIPGCKPLRQGLKADSILSCPSHLPIPQDLVSLALNSPFPTCLHTLCTCPSRHEGHIPQYPKFPVSQSILLPISRSHLNYCSPRPCQTLVLPAFSLNHCSAQKPPILGEHFSQKLIQITF